jgi:4-aminobutyrate aminotransferase-like enzyme
MFKTLDSLAMALLIRELAREHRIVTHFSGPDPDVLHLMPPLIVEERHIDHLADALDQVLSKGFLKLLGGLLKD